jgi:peptidoglycan/LPS O-acetylase OafA/YrhL
MGRGRHRGDIEGLRAVAVLGVVLFHAGVAPLAGGFLGVDVFFVISGYLITGAVARGLDRGRFSLATFYQRRVARIVPALLLTELAVLAAALLLCFPGELRALRGSAVAAPLFVSNLYFWRGDAYFAPPSEVEPLLHSWSLGIEEQFYLLYPLVLLAAGRRRKQRRAALIAGLAGASLAASAVVGAGDPQAAFYLLPTRLWELALGGLGALGLVAAPAGRPTRELLAAAAAAALLAAFVVTGPGTGTPFPAALVPCAATAVLLLVGEASWTGRLLATPPLRALGALSYAFYLWHWPVLAFWRLALGFSMTPAAQVGLVAGALALAALSWVAVERPLRRRLRAARPLPVLLGGAVAAVAVAALAWLATTGAYRLRPLPPRVAAILAAGEERIRPPFDPGCRAAGPAVTCLRPAPGRRTVLLAGDSHAEHIWAALAARFPELRFAVWIAPACRPAGRGAPPAGCEPRALGAVAAARDARAEGVVLAARWERDELTALADEIRALRAEGRDVTVVGPVVEYLPSVPALLARAERAGDRRVYDRGRILAREALDRAMEPLVRAAGGRYFSAYRAECPPAHPCRLFSRTGRPLHFDYGHYTADGAREIVAAMPLP